MRGGLAGFLTQETLTLFLLQTLGGFFWAAVYLATNDLAVRTGPKARDRNRNPPCEKRVREPRGALRKYKWEHLTSEVTKRTLTRTRTPLMRQRLQVAVVAHAMYK